MLSIICQNKPGFIMQLTEPIDETRHYTLDEIKQSYKGVYNIQTLRKHGQQ